jgi:hypothetical protein
MANQVKDVTPDFDDDAEKWVITDRDEDGMPLDQRGSYDTKKQASRAASQRKYALKTTRPVQARV